MKNPAVVILPISIDENGESAVKPYMAKNGLIFPTLIDQHRDVARQFGVRRTPTTVVVNRAGNIIAHGFGPFDLESSEFKQYRQALLAQSPG
jgi:peroxiredoxin